ncbi:MULTISPECIES: LPS translocon maturation chaperone LptM [Burkholderia]|jgi:predicted small lipoprotein YifL|uniref:Lipoprotein n=2 Tax=Burkholderia ambifaria TaxID=152480 RepID=Q0BJ09_BURCM|nr:lipoprotein [Burkholderia ambifaria]ABI85864.1 putative lipoprotein [Burkholderia ambifaria AMMD]AJY23448.1 prokaryotic lipo-attachment site family protein [Burkholderia ambifaria AMMD]MBR7933208.1 lipoprotein [Burkholderia ambifaria]MBR8185601.1 lipoprotein [Burkholderia ambifaria]MBR8347419.1 lipoprotein [Burkholderia ambifaria]
MRVVFRMSAIVAALAILAGCGQRGPLYLPTVPPLPAKPIQQQDTPPSDVKPTDENASDSIPDSSGTPLTLSPELSSSAPKPATPASGPAAAQ